jgi:uncharacterized membrane protein YczE
MIMIRTWVVATIVVLIGLMLMGAAITIIESASAAAQKREAVTQCVIEDTICQR